MRLRAHVKRGPAHAETRVFVGQEPGTLACAGVLITRAGDETDELVLALDCGGFDVVFETAATPEATT